jgi:hypothetical protein
MRLTDLQIRQYRDIYREVFGKEISQEKALEEGTKLVSLVRLVLLGIRSSGQLSEFPEISGQQVSKLVN